MRLGFIGLGRMGSAMVLHLLEEGVEVVVYNRTPKKIEELSAQIKNEKFNPAQPDQNSAKLYKAYQIEQLVQLLEPPRIIWLMIPQGNPVEEMIEQLLGSSPKVSREIHLRGVLDRTPRDKLEKGDIIIDGGNSFYKDSIRRYKKLKEKGIHFLDVGMSGGLQGARNGACLMVGGDRDIFGRLKPLFESLAVKGGVGYFGPAGAGHFAKMIHNGVEYGMLQAIGEGFEILAKGPYKLDLHQVAENWIKGSVVRGWLMELLEKALKKDPRLEEIEGVVGAGETGEWAVATAKELKVEVPVIEQSLKVRKKSRRKPTFSGKVIAALRREFGGHQVLRK